MSELVSPAALERARKRQEKDPLPPLDSNRVEKYRSMYAISQREKGDQ